MGTTFADYGDHGGVYSTMRGLDYVGNMTQGLYHGKHYATLEPQSQTSCFSHLSDHTGQRIHDLNPTGCALNYIYSGASYAYSQGSDANHYQQGTTDSNGNGVEYTHIQRHGRTTSSTPTAHYNGNYSENATSLNTTPARSSRLDQGSDSRPVNSDPDRQTTAATAPAEPQPNGETGMYNWMKIKRKPPKTGMLLTPMINDISYITGGHNIIVMSTWLIVTKHGF